MFRLLPLLAALALLAGCAGPRALDLAGSSPPVPSEGQRSKGFAESRSTAEALEASFQPRRIAVVIGVGSYEDSAFPDLKWAVKDAQEVGRILGDSTYGGFDRVVALTRPEAGRRDRILNELISLRNDLRRQDTLVVYFSGHGTMSLDESGEPQLFLVASDTRPGDLRGTAVELAEVQRFFSEIRAERKALILDACYNGEAKSALQPTVAQSIQRLDERPTLSRKVRLGQSEAHLFASTFGRPAREDDGLKHGVYTYHLLDALTWSQLAADENGDGLVSVYEAHDHARRGTISFTTGSQIPEAYFRLVGSNDVHLVGSAEARLEDSLGAVFYYGPVGDSFDGATLLVDGQEKGTFPGTFSVSPGRHQIKVVGLDGSILQERTVRVLAGEALAAEELRAQAPVRNAYLSAAPNVRFGISEKLHGLLGRAHAGAQIGGGYRFLVGPRGLTLSATLGYGHHQARFITTTDLFYRPRHLVWTKLGIGYRGQIGRVELGAGYRFRMQGITAIDEPSCGDHVACDAWFYVSHGLSTEQVIHLRGRWSLALEQSLSLSSLDLDGEGPRTLLDAGLSLGVQLAL